jgi:hypothetical protein
MHRHTAAETVREAPPEDADEVRERVIRKLLRLKERQKPE